MSTRSSRSSGVVNNDESSASATSGKRERSHSSSATSSSSSSRQAQRRSSNDAHEAVLEVDEDLIRPRVFKAHKDDLNAMVLSSIEIKEKQYDKWRKLSDEAQALCVKTVVRLLVMKGARKEPLTRNNVIDWLGKVDSNYKKHLDVVLMEAQKELEGVFGYSISSGDQVRGSTGGKKDDIYVFSILKSPRLLSSLSDLAEDEAAFTGFCFVIFQILFTSSGKSADAKTILQKLRKVDSRFPETLLARPKSSTARRANPVPELKDDFLGLMAQMKRRGYVVAVKDDKEPDDPGKTIFSIGTRFAVDLGKRRLMRAYFATIGQDMDPALMKEFLEEELAEEKARKDEDGEAGEGEAEQE